MDFYAENGVFSPTKILEAENGLQKSVGVYPNVFIQERGLIECLKAKEIIGSPWWADKNPPQEW